MSDAIVKHEAQGLTFTPEQRRMILDTFLSGASESEAGVLMELARVRRLNPITRQIHFVKRWDGNRQREVWSAQVGIDGFRTLAERTGLYGGQDEPSYEYGKDGKLAVCRVAVYRTNWQRPCVGVAHFSEYAQTYKDKKTGQQSLTQMWREKPHIMLAKCAEALALRKAFPDDLSGIYMEEELEGHGLSTEREVMPAAEAIAARLKAPAASPPRDADFVPRMPDITLRQRMVPVEPQAPHPAEAVRQRMEAAGFQATIEEPPPPADEDAPPDLPEAPPSPPIAPSPPKKARRRAPPLAE